MSDKRKENLPAKTAPKNKFLAGLMNLPKRVVKGFRDMLAELKKVTWPSRSVLINYSLIVFVFILTLAIVVYVFDLGAGAIVSLITNW